VIRAGTGGIARREPVAWAGIIAVAAGVLLHLPMYLGAGDAGYRLADMAVDAPMVVGMGLIVLGLVATTYGLLPKVAVTSRDSVARIRVRALDDAAIRPAHVVLMVAMAVAVTIDVMKPTALAFVVPGFAAEYGLKSPSNPGGHPPAALLPLAGITGTVIGSFTWGWLGDRIGRRASILLAGVLFIATAICGSMPSYALNLVMCFVMGLGVGGMLPIIFALIAETLPARHRGWLMVLIGGDVAGAYILTSRLSSTLVPDYSWRILWLIGLPTGLLLIGLNRWIPESPRFLLAHDREEQARAVMARYALAGDQVAHDRTLLYALLVVPIWGISSVVAVLAAYSSEVYPTRIRSRGTGMAAGASKAGGVLVIALVVGAVAPPTIAATALIGAIPMTLAALAALGFGVETRRRRLEQITAAELAAGSASKASGP